MFTAVCLLVLGSGVALIVGLRPVYQSQAMLLIDPRQSHFANIPSVVETPAQASDLNFVRSEQLILASNELAQRVVKRLSLEDDPDFMQRPSPLSLLTARVVSLLGIEQSDNEPQPAQGPDVALLIYQQRLSVFNDGKSFVIQVGFSHADPAKARAILAAHLELYLNDQRARKELVIAKAGRWLDQELARLRDKVQQSEQQLQAFRDQNRLVRSGGETISGRQLSDVTAQLARARGDLSRLSARSKEVSNGRPDSAVLNSDLVQRLRQQEATLSSEVAQLQQRYGSGHQKLTELRLALADVQSRTRSEIARFSASTSSDVAISRSDVQQLEYQVANLERQAVATSQAELSASQLDRETEADRRLYSDLLTRSKQVAIQKEVQEPDARVVSTPSLPVTPVSPRRGLLFVIAAAVAAVIAGGLVLLLDRFRQHTRSLAEMEAYHGVAGLGALPYIRRLRLADASRKASRLRNSGFSTALQVIGNSIALRMQDSGSKVIVVASSSRGDGRTSLAVLLARSFAEKGERVLLIDADLRRRGVTSCFGLEPVPGLIDAVWANGGLQEFVVAGAGQEPQTARSSGKELAFDVLPAGWDRADPHTILHRTALRSLVAEARARYGAVIIDTPPLTEVDDALAFVVEADATVLAVRWGRTSDRALKATLRRLQLANAHIVGAVLNGTTSGSQEVAPKSGLGNSNGSLDWAKAYLADRG